MQIQQHTSSNNDTREDISFLVPEIERMLCQVAGSPYAKSVPQDQLLKLPEEAIRVAHKYNQYFNKTDHVKIDISKDEYNATVLLPFAMRKKYRNNRKFFKAVVHPDFFTKVKRVALSSVCGAIAGGLVGGAFEVGAQSVKGYKDSHITHTSSSITKFHGEYSKQFAEHFPQAYNQSLLDKPLPAENLLKAMQFPADQDYRGSADQDQLDVASHNIFHGGCKAVESHWRNLDKIKENPELLKEYSAIEKHLALEGVSLHVSDDTEAFVLGTFKGAIMGEDRHHIALPVATAFAGGCALGLASAGVLSEIPTPAFSVTISSKEDLLNACGMGASVGGVVGAGYGLWNVNNPVVVKRISEIDKPI